MTRRSPSEIFAKLVALLPFAVVAKGVGSSNPFPWGPAGAAICFALIVVCAVEYRLRNQLRFAKG